MPGSSRTAAVMDRIAQWPIWKVFSRKEEASAAPAPNGSSARQAISTRRKARMGIPQLLDVYLLRSFIYYFVLLTVGFILLFEVFTFFDLLDDISQHRTGSN